MPEFICVQCDPSLLLASAAMKELESDLVPWAELENAAQTYHRYPERGPWVVRTIDEWEARHMGLPSGKTRSLIAAGGRRSRQDDEPYPLSGSFILAADAFVRFLKIPEDRIAPALRELFNQDIVEPQ